MLFVPHLLRVFTSKILNDVQGAETQTCMAVTASRQLPLPATSHVQVTPCRSLDLPRRSRPRITIRGSSTLFILAVETTQFCKSFHFSRRLVFTYATIQIRRPTNPPTPANPANRHGRHDIVLVYEQMRCGRVESRWSRGRARMLYVVYCVFRLLVVSDDDHCRVWKSTRPFTNFDFGPSK